MVGEAPDNGAALQVGAGLPAGVHGPDSSASQRSDYGLSPSLRAKSIGELTAACQGDVPTGDKEADEDAARARGYIQLSLGSPYRQRHAAPTLGG